MFIKGFFSNSVGIMTSRILGLIRDLLTASILGAGIFSDLFFIAFKIPNLFLSIFGEGAFILQIARKKRSFRLKFSSNFYFL